MDQTSDPTNWARSPVPHGNRTGRTCAHCGRPIPACRAQSALIPDSTVIHSHDPNFDGQRYVTACGSEHLQLLIDQAHRVWNDEQLWFGQLCRASNRPGMSGVVMAKLGEHAGLSADHLSRALAWNATSAEPRRTLPGGQIVPARRHESATSPPP
jgi:hypothetical protein